MSENNNSNQMPQGLRMPRLGKVLGVGAALTLALNSIPSPVEAAVGDPNQGGESNVELAQVAGTLPSTSVGSIPDLRVEETDSGARIHSNWGAFLLFGFNFGDRSPDWFSIAGITYNREGLPVVIVIDRDEVVHIIPIQTDEETLVVLEENLGTIDDPDEIFGPASQFIDKDLLARLMNPNSPQS
jgi:hypothetical protein